MKVRLGDRYRYYRLFFTIAALATLTPLMCVSHSIRGAPFLRWEVSLAVVKYLLQARMTGGF